MKAKNKSTKKYIGIILIGLAGLYLLSRVVKHNKQSQDIPSTQLPPVVPGTVTIMPVKPVIQSLTLDIATKGRPFYSNESFSVYTSPVSSAFLKVIPKDTYIGIVGDTQDGWTKFNYTINGNTYTLYALGKTKIKYEK